MSAKTFEFKVRVLAFATVTVEAESMEEAQKKISPGATRLHINGDMDIQEETAEIESVQEVCELIFPE